MSKGNEVRMSDVDMDNNGQLLSIDYGNLFNNKYVVMMIVDPETMEIIDANQAACAFYGYKHEEITKLQVSDINILSKELIKAEIKNAESELKNRFYFKHRTASGDIRFVEVSSNPIRYEGKEALCSIIHDITEQKRAEQELLKLKNELEKMVVERTCQLEEVNSELEELNAQLEEEISEHLKAENELQLAMNEIQDLYNKAPCGYHSLDKNGIFVQINDTELEWLGYKREEVIGKKAFVDFCDEAGKEKFRVNYPKFLQDGEIRDLEFNVVKRDGTKLTVLVSAVAVWDSAGNYLLSRTTCYDITEQNKTKEELQLLNSSLESIVQDRTNQLQDINAELEEANAMLEEEISERLSVEAALKRSEELYRSVYENSPLAFGIWDTEYRFVDWNKTAEEIFGWTKEEVLGKRFVDFLVPAEIKGAIIDVAWDLLSTGVERITFNENVTKDGKVLLCEWHNTLIHDSVGNLIGAVSLGLDKTDQVKSEKAIMQAKEQVEAANEELIKINSMLKNEITERIKIEEALIKSKSEAEQANIAKSQFLANMSHEIRTPMNGIMGMTELALMTELDDEQKNYLSMVKSSTTLLLRVLNDILDYSKIEAGKLDLEKMRFYIRDIIEEVVDLFFIAAAQKDLYIKVNVDNKIPQSLLGDPIRLRQVLSNLVGNAVKFTLKGGITIYVEMLEKLDSEIRLKFIVEDSGIGIAAEKIDKLFKRFSQVDESNTREFGGTGLGLAISKRLIEMMEGSIEMESSEGMGSRFYFTAVFGIIMDESIKDTDNHNDDVYTQITATDTKNILLVDDDEVSRNLTFILLKKKGFKVVTAENGDEAVKLFERDKFDLILLDVHMPQLDGYSTVDLIRKQEKLKATHTPIIAVTAHALSGEREKCINAGMDDYISKPIDVKKLYKLIDTWVKNETK